jgi:hypothetical protein
MAAHLFRHPCASTPTSTAPARPFSIAGPDVPSPLPTRARGVQRSPRRPPTCEDHLDSNTCRLGTVQSCACRVSTEWPRSVIWQNGNCLTRVTRVSYRACGPPQAPVAEKCWLQGRGLWCFCGLGGARGSTDICTDRRATHDGDGPHPHMYSTHVQRTYMYMSCAHVHDLIDYLTTARRPSYVPVHAGCDVPYDSLE